VDVAGHDGQHLRVAGQQLLEAGAVAAVEHERIDCRDADAHRRMVEREQGRSVPRGAELAREPRELLVAEPSLGVAGDERVAGEDAQVARGDRAAQRARPVEAERPAQGVAVVVVARDDVHRRAQRAEQLGRAAGVLGRPGVGEVAGDQDAVGRGLERGDRVDRRAHALLAGDVGAAEVHVGELDDVGHVGAFGTVCATASQDQCVTRARRPAPNALTARTASWVLCVTR
jgi:hypothetical protein